MHHRNRHVPPNEDRQQLTSMIDVVFLLLVFFVCTMTFRVIEGRIDTQLPKGTGGNPGPAVDLIEPLEIHVGLDARRPAGIAVRVSGQLRDVEQVAGLVARARALVPEIPVRLSTGSDVTYGQVMAVVDEVLAGGIERVHFAG